MNTIPPKCALKKTFIPNLKKLFDFYIEDMTYFLRKNLFEPVETVDNNIVQSLMRILDCYFVDYIDTEIKEILPEDVEHLESILE